MSEFVEVPSVQMYATFNTDGTCKACYASDIHTNIPEDAVKITKDQWQDLINNRNDRRYDPLTKKMRNAMGVEVIIGGAPLVNAKLR